MSAEVQKEQVNVENSSTKKEINANLSPEQKEVLEEINLLQKELEWLDATKAYTKKAGSYLEKRLSTDMEAQSDPEAKPTIELLERYKRQFREAVTSSNDISAELQILKQNIAKLWDSLEFKKGIDSSKKFERNTVSNEKLKTITNNEFLKLPKSERLQYVTKNNVDYNNIANWNVKEVTFFFDQDWNWKDDSDLYFMTTIGQLMWKEVWELESGWKIYSRDSINWEFFNWNKRLVIHTDTQITINKIRTPEELKNLQESTDKDFEKYKNLPNFDIAKEALDRWIDWDFAMLIFSEALKLLSWIERKVKTEEIFTQFDRFRNDIPNWDWKKMENGKYPDEIVVYLLREYGKNWEDKAKEYWIDVTKIKEKESKKYIKFLDIDVNNLPEWDKWLLEFISVAEWTRWNYNAIYWKGEQSSIDFTAMTLKEVLNYQKTYKIWKGSAAIWKYQFMDYTLKDMIRQYWISMDEKFTPEIQDRLALLKLKERWLDSFKSWQISQDDFQVALSKEWASIATNERGKSYYEGDTIWNHALVSDEQVDWVLERLKNSVV
jgi:muramidase (phage lysozyme)